MSGAPIHDALAVSHIVDESILTLERFHVDVETRGETTRCEAVVDVYGVTGRPPNACVAVDLGRFRRLLLDSIKRFDRV